MKTCTFIFWIYLLVLFPQGLFSKSSTGKEEYRSDSKNSETNVGNEDAALHESFRPRHKYKANGHQTRVSRSEAEDIKDHESKAPQCAVMYKDNEPVGILQPFKESYRFLPISGDPTLVDLNPIPVKRKTFMDVLYPNNKMNEDYNEETVENTNQFADERYPSIFAKFKIDSRLDKTLNPDLNMKRSMFRRDTDKPDISDEQVSSLKNTLTKMKGDNSAVVEEELKNILDDMGLIDDYDESKEEAKRDAEEDENMEQGTNKINLVKEVHNETRNKRSDLNSTMDPQIFNSTTATLTTTFAAVATSMLSSSPPTILAVAVAMPTKIQFEEDRTGEAESIDLFKDNEVKVNDDSEKEDLEVSTEAESEDSRKKRQPAEKKAEEISVKHVKRDDNTDDLPEINLNATTTGTLVKQAELSEYEKRVEREIRDKIQRLKEEVKEEIKSLKGNTQVKSEESDSRRRKRQVVSTLIDEETPNIDPNLNDENPQQEHHVRRKRSLDSNGSLVMNNGKYNTTNSSQTSDKLNEKYQMIDEGKDGLRFIINFGDIDPDIKEKVDSGKRLQSIEKSVVHAPSAASNNNTTNSLKVDRNNTNVVPYTPKRSNFNATINNTNVDHNNVGNNVTHNVTSKQGKHSVGQKDKKDIQYTIKNQKLPPKFFMRRDGKFRNRKAMSNNIKNFVPSISNGQTNSPGNIIDALNAIGKKKPVRRNYDNNKKTHNCSKCQMKQQFSGGNETEIKNINLNEISGNQQFIDTPTAKYAEVIDNNKYKALNLKRNQESKIFEVQDKIMKAVSKASKIMKEVSNKKKEKRFIGITPILENVTNSTGHFHSRKLNQYDNNIKANVDFYDEKILQEIENIGNIKRFVRTNPFEESNADNHYFSRNLKNIGEDASKVKPANESHTDAVKANPESHVRVKRSLDVDKNSDGTNTRRKRQATDDTAENAYQYDDPEFNEEAANENQSYYDQPYANEDNIAAAKQANSFLSNVKSNCNCDKTGSGCKCGTQRTDLSVPNVKEEYSDYEDHPKGVMEKKSASHCNCDKNGKNCKCQTFGESGRHQQTFREGGVEYGDYTSEDEQQQEAEKRKSSDLDEDAPALASDGVGERVPRRSQRRQRRRNVAGGRRPMENSEGEEAAVDYYENYEAEGGKVKREAKPRKLTGRQQFQNGEYFVDLHPDVYRLTPVETSRKKRDSFKDLVALHGGGPVVNHLVAIKQRSMIPHSRIRRRVQMEDNREPRQLIDMSDEDLFGALPQSFAGELARYKRVKRDRGEK